jgi:CRISPR-associated protein Csb1
MPVNFESLGGKPRILIEADLKPIAGTRIQPTGFPDLGPATYDAPDGTPTLLVESAQSMANRLESVCWDEATDDIALELKGLPFVRVALAGLGNGKDTTSSLLEFHRLNSPYIMAGVGKDGKVFAEVLKPEIGMAMVAAPHGKKGKAKGKDEEATEEVAVDKERDDVAGVVNLRKLAAVCFKYDPNSLVHGCFWKRSLVACDIRARYPHLLRQAALVEPIAAA